jgi:hypothetical protein
MADELLPAARKAAPLDASMIVSLVAVGGVGVLFSLAGLFWLGPSAGLGISVGSMVATINLWLFAQVGRGVLGGGSRGRLWGLVGAAKFLALFAGAWLLLKAELTTPLTLAIGYAAMPVGITVGAFLRGASVPNKKLVPATPPDADRD